MGDPGHRHLRLAGRQGLPHAELLYAGDRRGPFQLGRLRLDGGPPPFDPLPWAEVWNAADPGAARNGPISAADLEPAVVDGDVDGTDHAGLLVERAAEVGILHSAGGAAYELDPRYVPTRTPEPTSASTPGPTRSWDTTPTPWPNITPTPTTGTPAAGTPTAMEGPDFGAVSALVALLWCAVSARRRSR